ncbi:MAG: DNA polymerase I [Erysipelotrichaceae bacterium]|nr:DNA polymerase I [Erysipelotrichaceae bacterium]
MKKLLLIDGNSLVFRAYHATMYGKMMTTSNGIPTNALYGFALMMQKAIELITPDRILVAFDAGKKTFRHDVYAEYKGTRKPADDELKIQFPIVREYLDAMNISRYEQEGIEADDIIGSMVKKYPDWQINVLSSDKDLLQLIDETTSVWLMKKGLSEIEEMDIEALYARYQLAPKQIIDLKGLMGDASDNIPGIPKVGEKTALKLLEQFGSVENLLANTSELKGKLKENVEANAHLALLSKDLATIRTDFNLPIDIDSLTYEVDVKKIYDFYRKYEMESFLKKLDVPVENTDTELTYEIVDSIANVELNEPTALYYAYDLRNPDMMYGYALKNSRGCYYIRYEDTLKDIAWDAWLASDSIKIVYDIKELLHVQDRFGLTKLSKYFDMMLSSFLNHSQTNHYELLLEQNNLHISYTLEDLFGKVNKPILVEEERVVQYACEQAHALFVLYPIVKEQMKQLQLESLYYDVELPLASVLYEMEKTGIRMEEDVLDQIAKETYQKLQDLSAVIYEYAEEEFNINSPKKLGEILYDKLGLPSGKKRSTAVDVLEKLRSAHPIIEYLMEYRKYQKLYSTYAEGLKKYIHEDGKIHTKYNQCVTQTGRLSSSEPNLQNISVRSEEAREIRKAFVPEKGCVLVSADYSQVELRILAHLANEQQLIDAFCSNMDIHTKTAMDVFKVAENEVDSNMRRKAKAVNFGIVYGISDFGLSEQLQITRKEAQSYIQSYFESYPGIKKYMDDVVSFCEENGYVVTMLNRKRDIPEIKDKNYMVREFGKRAAMNAPVQGTAADLIKVAMIHIANRMKELNLRSQMILQVHDELIFNVYEEELEQMRHLIEYEMEHAFTLQVPLVAQSVCGATWYEAK